MEVLRDHGRFCWYRLKKDAANCGDCRCWRNVLWMISDLELIECLIAATAPDIIQFKLSDIGEGIAEVVVKEWWVGHYQSINQSIKRLINRESSQSLSQSINQSINQLINHSIIQSINRLIKGPSKNKFRLLLRFFSHFFCICSATGLWNPVPKSTSLTRFVRCRATKRRWRSRAATTVWSVSCITAWTTSPKSAPLLWIFDSPKAPRPVQVIFFGYS